MSERRIKPTSLGAVARELRSRHPQGFEWAVYSVKKNGDLHAKSERLFRTEQQAVEKAEYLRSMNPGDEFRVVRIGGAK